MTINMMRRRVLSLWLRLLLAGTVAIVLAVGLSAFGLSMLFRQHVESWIDKQLDAHLVQLISSLDRDASGALALRTELAEPRFRQPFSGMYWEVAVEQGQVLRSRSLWDQDIKLPKVASSDGNLVHLTLAGPQGEALYTLQRRVVLPDRLGRRTAVVAVAIDDSEVNAAVLEFATVLVPFLATIGALLAAAAWIQVRIGLKPLERVKTRLAEIRRGEQRRLSTDWPTEVRPLAEEIDALLGAQERQVSKARARAADLAHALKTPLQVMRSEAQKLAGRGDADTAASLQSLVLMMSRHVDRQMVRARLGDARGDAETELAGPVEQVINVVRRSATGLRLDWRRDVAQKQTARIDPDDLVEALGNLLENAARHARTTVTITAARDGDQVTIKVLDDGPGISPAALSSICDRGVRLDTSPTGAGLGLAIVQDIAEAWGGGLNLENTPIGFCARLTLLSGHQTVATTGPVRDEAGSPGLTVREHPNRIGGPPPA